MPDSLVRWDVVEEHLDEAEFCVEQWLACIESPLYALGDLRDGPEERLFAHVDGLVLGDAEVADELLRPIFAEGEAEMERAAAAALALLSDPRPAWGQPVVDELPTYEGPIQSGAETALAMLDRTDLDARLTAALERAKDSDRTPYIRVLGRRGVSLDRRIDGDLGADDPERIAASLRAVRFAADRGRYISAAEHFAHHDDEAVRRMAMATGLVLGSGNVWAQALTQATRSTDSDAMIYAAMFGEPGVVSRLIERMTEDEVRADIVLALGYSGAAPAAAACLKWLDDETVGPLAGEAFVAITGLDPTDDEFWVEPEETEDDEEVPELEEDDLEADLVPPVESELPLPNPEAIRRWWAEHGSRFDPGHRYYAGRPASKDTLAQALRESSLRRCPWLAFELLVRTRGAGRVVLRRQAGVALRQLESLGQLRNFDGRTPYPGIS